MEMKKIFMPLFLILITGCSSLSFNERFNNAGWKKVIIAPFSGDSASIAEIEFEHELAVSSKLNIISSSMVMVLLGEHDLLTSYTDKPNETIFLLAKKLSAEGVIFADIKAITPKNSRAEIASSYASIYAKLVDSNSKSIVASSQHESNSIFSNSHSLIKNVSSQAIDDFNEYFDKLK